GVLYLWIFPQNRYHFWPHYLLLSFYIFAFLFISAVLISLLDRSAVVADTSHSDAAADIKPTGRVWLSWILLAIVMITLYIIFNGH
ncbi:MAG: Na+/glucose cotransporter, partial [Flavisolibacter sp.]